MDDGNLFIYHTGNSSTETPAKADQVSQLQKSFCVIPAKAGIQSS